MIEKKRTLPKFEELMTLEDFRFYCERQFVTDVAILDNDPRFQPSYIDRYNQVRQEIAEMTNEIKYSAKWWAKNKEDNQTKIVTEFIDALHFYCGLLMMDMIKERHFKHSKFDRDTLEAYEKLKTLYNLQTIEEAGVYSYSESDAVRRFLINEAFKAFDKSAAHCMAVSFKIISTLDIQKGELLDAYIDKNEIVHARNSSGDY